MAILPLVSAQCPPPAVFLSYSSIWESCLLSVSVGLKLQTNEYKLSTLRDFVDKMTPQALEWSGRPKHTHVKAAYFFSRRPRSILGNAPWQEAFKFPRPLDTADMIRTSISASKYEWIMESMKGRINEALQFANREMGKGLGRQLPEGMGGWGGVTPHPGFYKSLEVGENRLAIKCSSYKILDIFCKI